MFRYFCLLVYRYKYFFIHLFRVVGSGKSIPTFNFGNALEPIFGHKILADECRLCLAVRPIVEPLIVEIRLFVALICSCVLVRNVAVDNAIVGYRHGLVVGAVELDNVRQGEFSAPFCIVFRYYSSGFFVLHFHTQLYGGGNTHRLLASIPWKFHSTFGGIPYSANPPLTFH